MARVSVDDGSIGRSARARCRRYFRRSERRLCCRKLDLKPGCAIPELGTTLSRLRSWRKLHGRDGCVVSAGCLHVCRSATELCRLTKRQSCKTANSHPAELCANIRKSDRQSHLPRGMLIASVVSFAREQARSLAPLSAPRRYIQLSREEMTAASTARANLGEPQWNCF